MRKLEYKKIKLRDFRHKFTQLKDSIASGQAYEVLERGEPIGYFIPSQFDIKVKDTKLQNSRRTLIKQNLLEAQGKFRLKKEVENFKDIKEAYRYLLRKKYLKDE